MKRSNELGRQHNHAHLDACPGGAGGRGGSSVMSWAIYHRDTRQLPTDTLSTDEWGG